jgi:thioredoxin 1
MNTKSIGIILIIIILGIVGIFILRQSSESPVDGMMEVKTDDGMMTTNDEEAIDQKMETAPDAMELSVSSYQDYSEGAVKLAQDNDKKSILFFWANWCPFCKKADAAFLADMDRIPEDVVIFKTNYDTEKDLKKKYAISYQHTFVQIDKEGEEVAKWVSGDFDTLFDNLK